ncbi:MAG: MlaD family protein [Alphaproteobacteria bacterium]
METKASHVFVGLFTVTLFAALFGFILWLVSDGGDASRTRYDILFDGSVTGLGTASEVRYKGLKVGEVVEISLYEGDRRKVLVGVEVDEKTPIDTTTIAKIDYLGVTGVGFIQLTGGGSDIAQPLTAQSVNDHLVIPSVPSDIAQLLEGAPEVLAQSVALLEQFRQIFNPESIRSITSTIQNIERITGSFAGQDDQIQNIIKNAASISDDMQTAVAALKTMSVEMESTIGSANTLIDEDLRGAVQDVRTLTESYTKLGNALTVTVNAAQPGIVSFSEHGLSDLGLLVAETRGAIAALEKTIQAFETNPARFVLSNGGAREYSPAGR